MDAPLLVLAFCAEVLYVEREPQSSCLSLLPRLHAVETDCPGLSL